jgi:hypothetical protein
VQQQYEAYFKLLLGPRVSDFRAIATRQPAGDYYSFRFREKTSSRYQPFELTQAGAVFEFSVGPEEASILQDRLRTGLPPMIAGQLLHNGEKNWEVCPFMNHNGYGEISLDDGWIEAGVSRLEVLL